MQLNVPPQDGWRHVVSQAVMLGVPTPCFSTALSFYDGYRSDICPHFKI
jgi:6-phosphogluconate dehydrogenase